MSINSKISMSPPSRYWRFSYDSDELVTRMIAAGDLSTPKTGLRTGKYDPESCIASKIRVGDGVFLGKLDPDLGVGKIVAIGIVRSAKPVTRVEWKRLKRDVYPNPQGGVPAWREQCFLFDRVPAERYNLAGEFKAQFPDE
jgi:hypothetical protein